MKFNDCTSYYYSLPEAKKDPRRKELFERNEDFLESMETTLFDTYGVNGVYIINDFFDKQKFFIDRLPILFSMKKKQFEEFVDKREAEFLTEQFDIYIETESDIFHYDNGFWKSGCDKIIKKELWNQ